MNLSNKQKVGAVVLYTLVAVAFGRYLAPEKVKIEKEIVKSEVSTEKTNDKTQTDSNRDKHIKKVVNEKVNRDGSKETTTTVTEDSTTRRDSISTNKSLLSDTKTETSKETKEVSRGGSKTTLSVLSAIDVSNPSSGLKYGMHVSKQLIGPLSIGILGMTNGTAGCSVGLSF